MATLIIDTVDIENRIKQIRAIMECDRLTLTNQYEKQKRKNQCKGEILGLEYILENGIRK